MYNDTSNWLCYSLSLRGRSEWRVKCVSAGCFVGSGVEFEDRVSILGAWR